jgi:glycosyltransferase involved in cell wall biosynthesis
MTPKLTVINAQYNQPDNLHLILAALGRQSFQEFELIIADDGSGQTVRDIVTSAQAQSSFPIIHLWHEDKGWRKNVIYNKAIVMARTEYLVFMDGDCLPSRHFLLDHWNEREQKRVLFGRRVEATERWSKTLSVESIKSGAFERYGLIEWWEALSGKSLRVEDGLRFPSKVVRKLLLRDVKTMLGCNFSIWKSDMLAINGFDELYHGPGYGEDSDLQYRLSLIGVTGKSMRNLAIQYHIYHKPTLASSKNRERLEMVMKSGRARCQMGIEKLQS